MRAALQDHWHDTRHRMVRRDLAARGVTDPRVLAAMAAIPRHDFVPEHLYDRAYDDVALPAAHGQTISQPYIVALMTREARLTRHARVLDVGTGTGYHAAVLALLAAHVWTVERIGELAGAATRRLAEAGIRNVTSVVGDGAAGYPQAAPFDAIVVSAATPLAPQPLLDQLALRGRLVVPVGGRAEQRLKVYERTSEGLTQRDVGACRFVPLISPGAFEA